MPYKDPQKNKEQIKKYQEKRNDPEFMQKQRDHAKKYRSKYE